MENADPVERKWACVAVSNLIHNDPSTRRLLQGKNVVGTLIGRLTDSEEEVVVEAAGALRCVLSVFLFRVSFLINKLQLLITNFPSRALRNLCIDGGYEICAEMYNKNILAPLATFIPKVSARSGTPLCANPCFASRSPRFYHNTSTLRRQRPRMHRKLSTSFLKMSLPSCGASRKFDTTMLRGGSSPTLSAPSRAILGCLTNRSAGKHRTRL